MSKRLILTSGMIIVSLALSATAFASESAYRMRNFQTKIPAIIGVVSSISGSSITLNTKKGIAYVVDTSNAKITKSDSQIRMSDILNGDTLMVVGAVDNNNIEATKIVDGVIKNNSFKANYFAGKVTSVSGSTFIIQSAGKKQSSNETIKVDNSTVFTKDGQNVSLASLTSGQTVIVTGTKEGNVITAASVNIRVNKAGTRIIGTIASVSSNTISVKDSNGTTYTVNTSKVKTIGRNKVFQVGEKIVVFGSQTSGTTDVMATVIREYNS